MPQGIGAEVPVEALLKVVFDKSGGDAIQQFLNQQQAGWKTIEGHVSNVSGAISNISSTVQKLAGVAGVGALVVQFSNLSNAASSAALASGVVTGSSASYGGYTKALSSAQAKTGVGSTQIAQGFIQAVMMVGGRPSAAQAGMIGALLGGFGLSVGMTPAQVAQVIGPILLNTGQSLTAGSAASVAATLQQGLSQFPGSQSGPAMQVVSGEVQATAQGAGKAVSTNTPAQDTALVNLAARLNPAIFGHGNVTGQSGALAGISGGLQGAYSNMGIEATLRMAGLGSYSQQRLGATPQNLLTLVQGLLKSQPNATSRDILERQDFGGISGANLLNTLETPQGIAGLEAAINAKSGSKTTLAKTVANVQAGTTPEALLTKAAGGLEHAVGGLENTLLKWAGAIEKWAGPGVVGVASAAAPVVASLGSDAVKLLVAKKLIGSIAARAAGGAATDAVAGATADVGATAGLETAGVGLDATGFGLPLGLLLGAAGLIAGSGTITNTMDSLLGLGGHVPLSPGETEAQANAAMKAAGYPSVAISALDKKAFPAGKPGAHVGSDGKVSMTATDSILGDQLHQQKLTLSVLDASLAEYTKDTRAANVLLGQIYREQQLTVTALDAILGEYRTAAPGTPGTAGTAKATASRTGMATAILKDLGIKPTTANMSDLVSWETIEGGTANNPLNSTLAVKGSHGNRPGMQSTIQAYMNATSGANATAQTMEAYKSILAALRNGTSMPGFASLVANAPGPGGHHWGTQATGWPTVTVYVDGTKARNARVLKKKTH
jgi:hypothetical protein